ncbi:MAG: hypothetical protein ACOCP4_06825 [Candidatus Woesearchaeota archaeon]
MEIEITRWILKTIGVFKMANVKDKNDQLLYTKVVMIVFLVFLIILIFASVI